MKAANISRVDVLETTAARSLNAFNENIRSLREVNFPGYGVARPSTLVSMSLHSNRLSSLEGFSSMTVSDDDVLLIKKQTTKNVHDLPVPLFAVVRLSEAVNDHFSESVNVQAFWPSHG